LQKRDLKPLHHFRAGARVLIREVQDDNPDRLRHWQNLGLIPGVVVHFVSYQPLDDMFNLQVGDHTIHVGSEGLAACAANRRRPNDAVPGPAPAHSQAPASQVWIRRRRECHFATPAFSC